MAEAMETTGTIPATEHQPAMAPGTTASVAPEQTSLPLETSATSTAPATPAIPVKEITIAELTSMVKNDDPAIKEIMASKDLREKLASGDYSILKGMKVKESSAAAPATSTELAGITPAANTETGSTAEAAPVEDETLGSKSKKQLREIAKNRGEGYERAKKERDSLREQNTSLAERIRLLEEATKKNIPAIPATPAQPIADDPEPSFEGIEQFTEDWAKKDNEHRQWMKRQLSKQAAANDELRKAIESTRTLQSDTTTQEIESLKQIAKTNEDQLYAMEISEFQENIPELQTQRHPLDIKKDLIADSQGNGGDFSRKVNQTIPEVTTYPQVFEILIGESDNAKRWKNQLQTAGIAIPDEYIKYAKLAEVESYRTNHTTVKRNDKGQIVGHEPLSFDKAYLLLKNDRGELQSALKQERHEAAQGVLNAIEKAKSQFAPEIPASRVNAESAQSPENWTSQQEQAFLAKISRMDAIDIMRDPYLVETLKILKQKAQKG